MKYFVLASMYIIFLVSCNTERKIDEEALIEQEIASGIRNDTIFFGYTFGMSPKEFMIRTESLIKDDKLLRNKEKELVFEITLDEFTTFNGFIEPYYYEDKLYKMRLIVNGFDGLKGDLMNSSSFTVANLALFFIKKYGAPNREELELNIEDGCEDYTWISGNRRIKIVCGLDKKGIVIYEDLISIKKQEEIQEKITNEKIEESRNDI